ncbi:phage holin family protein [Eubacteriales bacterium OttesenSCG-928-M02]|nr:phage holin family protein [Eubacteriales bacterium OttesenSCG-928-M02]
MEIMEILQQFVVLVVLGICLGVGFIIKHSLDFIPNKFIPLIMGILGVVLNVWINGAFTPETLLGGLASGLASTGAFELVRQQLPEKKEEEKTVEE